MPQQTASKAPLFMLLVVTLVFLFVLFAGSTPSILIPKTPPVQVVAPASLASPDVK